jgi:flagellar basal-body rod protein FlgC
MEFRAIDTAASALQSERLRMDTIAANIANANSTRDENGNVNAYKRKFINFQTIFNEQQEAIGVEAVISEDQSDPKLVYDPAHPDANKEGLVAYPNIAREREMAELLQAKASYQANIKSIQVAKQIFNAGLEI